MNISHDVAPSSCNLVVRTADGLFILWWPRTPAFMHYIVILSALLPGNSAIKPIRNCLTILTISWCRQAYRVYRGTGKCSREEGVVVEKSPNEVRNDVMLFSSSTPFSTMYSLIWLLLSLMGPISINPSYIWMHICACKAMPALLHIMFWTNYRE